MIEKNLVNARFPVSRKLWGEVKGEATARALKVSELMEEILKKRYDK